MCASRLFQGAAPAGSGNKPPEPVNDIELEVLLRGNLLQQQQQHILVLEQTLQETCNEIENLKGCVSEFDREPLVRKEPAGHAGPVPAQSNSTAAKSRSQSRYWTADEHKQFLVGLEKFGTRDVKSIATFVGTRNATQVRTHAQKYFLRMGVGPHANPHTQTRAKDDLKPLGGHENREEQGGGAMRRIDPPKRGPDGASAYSNEVAGGRPMYGTAQAPGGAGPTNSVAPRAGVQVMPGGVPYATNPPYTTSVPSTAPGPPPPLTSAISVPQTVPPPVSQPAAPPVATPSSNPLQGSGA